MRRGRWRRRKGRRIPENDGFARDILKTWHVPDVAFKIADNEDFAGDI